MWFGYHLSDLPLTLLNFTAHSVTFHSYYLTSLLSENMLCCKFCPPLANIISVGVWCHVIEIIWYHASLGGRETPGFGDPQFDIDFQRQGGVGWAVICQFWNPQIPLPGGPSNSFNKGHLLYWMNCCPTSSNVWVCSTPLELYLSNPD